MEPLAVSRIMASTFREESEPPQLVTQTIAPPGCVPAAQSGPEQLAETGAEAQPEQADADAGQQQEEPGAAADDSPLQQCAHHRQLSSANCVHCPDCRMRCKRCRVVKALADFKLVFKAKQPGAALEPYLKATCKACRSVAASQPSTRSNTSAAAAATDTGVHLLQSSLEASGLTAAAQQRAEAVSIPEDEQPQQQEVPDAARLHSDAVPSISAASEPKQLDRPEAAAPLTLTDAPADCTAESAGHSQGPPAPAPSELRSPPDSAQQLEPQHLPAAILPAHVQHHEAAASAGDIEEHAAACEEAAPDRGAEDATSASDAHPADTEVQEEDSNEVGEAALRGTEAAGGQQKQQQQQRQGAAEDAQTPVRVSRWLFLVSQVVSMAWYAQPRHTYVSPSSHFVLACEQESQQIASQRGAGGRAAAAPQRGAAVSDPERVPNGTPGSGQSPLSVRSHAPHVLTPCQRRLSIAMRLVT